MAKRSAIESVPGRDALLEYESKSYPAKTYVERNGIIFKSLTATSETFVSSQWELVSDFRDVRVPDIAARNSLTGTTGTSYGVHTPILDNTNVLVLDASADPEVGVAQFARYNYNQPNQSWLILQIGTGSTSAATSIEYSNVLNRPSVVSGVTVNANAGLSGGGSVFGSIPAAGGVINLAHADTSSQANVTPTGRTYVQQLRFDTFGHVTGATQSTWTHPDTSSQANVLNTGRTYIQSISVDGDGHITNISSSPWTHPDTSSQGSSINAGNVFIQTVHLDGDGHVTGIVTGVAAGGGGGSSPLTYNGDSGGALTMNTGSTLTISGGTNILTQRTGNAANPGLKINLNPSGLAGQLQYNGGSGLSASPNLFFSAGTSTLRTSNLVIGATPVSGSTADEIITRNITTGAIQRLGYGTLVNSITSLPINAVQYRTATGLGGHTNWLFDPSARALTLGSRTGTTGTHSLVVGFDNRASGNYSVAEGFVTTASAIGAHAEGNRTVASGFQAHAEGFRTNALGPWSHSAGNFTTASTDASHAQGIGTLATGIASFVGGYNLSGAGYAKAPLAGGQSSFVFTTTDSLQTAGYGALANRSVILGGINNHINSLNTNAAIIGGNTVQVTTSGYNDHTIVSNLAIWASPAINNTDDLLVLNATTKKIERTTRASLAGGGSTPPAGSNSQIQYNNNGLFGASAALIFVTGSSTLIASNIGIGTAPSVGVLSNNVLLRNTGTGNIETITTASLAAALGSAGNGLNKSGSVYRLGGLITGNTTINGTFDFFFNNNAWTFGTRSGATGTNSITAGQNNLASGNYSQAFGSSARATNQYAHAQGANTRASGWASHAGGVSTTASGDQSYAYGGSQIIGKGVLAAGDTSFNHSFNTIAQTVGHGALASYSAILGGQNHNIESGNTSATIIGGSLIKLTGTTYINHTAVANLAIMSAPALYTSSDDILVRRSTTGTIGRITQASLAGTANNGLTKFGSNTRLGGPLTGATTISGVHGLFFTNNFVTIGSRSGTTGLNSFTSGVNNLASGLQSVAMGQESKATSDAAFASGLKAYALGFYSHAQNVQSIASGTASSASGQLSIASGDYSYAGGLGLPTKETLASGQASFNHSAANSSQTVGHGALASNSAILGGVNHNIEATNPRAAIIGGQGIKLTGSTYTDTTAVSNLAVMALPALGTSSDDILVRRSTTGKIFRVTQASLFSANNGINKIGTNIRLGGALTGNTTISGVGIDLFFTNRSITFGARSGNVGNNSFVIGTGTASGSSSIAIGGGLAVGNTSIATGSGKAFGDQSTALGFNNESHGTASFSSGNNNRATGNYSFAVGVGSLASGVGAFASGTIFSIGTPRLQAGGQASFNHSYNTLVQSVGAGAMAPFSAILGGQDHNIMSGNTNAVIIGGNGVVLTGSSYASHAVVQHLAIRGLPTTGVNTDNVLVRRGTNGRIMQVTQASISDGRLKKNLEPLTGVLDKIDKLSTVEFQYNEKNQPELHDRKDYGLIAQEVEELYPYVVNDNLKIEGDEQAYKTVEYRKLVPILFAAIKELRAEINQLKNNNSCGDCKCHG